MQFNLVQRQIKRKYLNTTRLLSIEQGTEFHHMPSPTPAPAGLEPLHSTPYSRRTFH